SVPVVLNACKENKLLGENGCETNGLGNFNKIRFWKTPVSNCRSQSSCVPYYRWVTDYIAVLGGR
ncbi:MAG: spermidine/putrescine ABC transporter substrate-binding protein, partial [Gammaproteobacteria bacterium]|nr:spermidine/putrescine ABC transporter substrate-binding protein [Gammaproteobacteria bacterium]